MNAREAALRQRIIRDGLRHMITILETTMIDELDPEQEMELVRIITLGNKWMAKREA